MVRDIGFRGLGVWWVRLGVIGLRVEFIFE